MTDVVSEVNFIRSRGQNHRQFRAFLDESEVNIVTLYSAVKLIGLTKVRFCKVSLLEEIPVVLTGR